MSVTAPFFTVVTPTLDRAATLPRPYGSLMAQTCRDFEWLVVDGGYDAETADLMTAWATEAEFPIRHLRRPGMTLQARSNLALEAARGRLWVKLDSDDECMPHALERLRHYWERLSETQRRHVAGVCCLCVDRQGELVGDPFPRDWMVCDLNEMRYRHGLRGEKWGANRSDVMRRLRFAEPAGVDYVPELELWSRIALEHPLLFVNEPLRVYRTDSPGRLSEIDVRRADMAGGTALWYRHVIDRELGWFWRAPRAFLRAGVNYGRLALHAGWPLRDQVRALDRPAARALWAVGLPLARVLVARDRRRSEL